MNHRFNIARQGGFTMVELIIVMVLIGIMAAIAAGRFFDRSGFETRAYADQVRAMLRYAQKAAIARNNPVYVRFEEHRISLCHAVPEAGCPAEALVVSPAGFDGDGAHCGSGSGYCLGKPDGLAWDATPAQDWIMFDGLGRPVLANGKPAGISLTLSAGSETEQVHVTGETGYVQ